MEACLRFKLRLIKRQFQLLCDLPFLVYAGIFSIFLPVD